MGRELVGYRIRAFDPEKDEYVYLNSRPSAPFYWHASIDYDVCSKNRAVIEAWYSRFVATAQIKTDLLGDKIKITNPRIVAVYRQTKHEAFDVPYKFAWKAQTLITNDTGVQKPDLICFWSNPKSNRLKSPYAAIVQHIRDLANVRSGVIQGARLVAPNGAIASEMVKTDLTKHRMLDER